MNTLYDVLGISSQTNATQIEQGYRSIMASLNGDGANYEQDMIRAKAIKEAYAILSSPARRQAYDEKLKLKEQVSYQVVETPGVPWGSLAAIGLVLVASLGIYKYHAQKVELERVALEAAKAKTAAQEAASLREAEESRLAQQLLRDKSQAESNRQREAEQARQDGQRIHYELQVADAQAEREKERVEYDKERTARAVKYERLEDERAAQNRSRNQIANMQRALAIPILRH